MAVVSSHGSGKLKRAGLLTPAIFILGVAAVGPLVIVLIYSFLKAGPYGGVEWELSGKAWLNLFLSRDPFTGELAWADANLSILWRSIRLATYTLLVTFLIGFPTAYFIATRPERQRSAWLLVIIIPFWTNLLIRAFAIREMIRNEGVVNTAFISLGIADTPIQMLYTEFAIVLGMTYVYLPLMVLPIYSSLERLDFRLVEAAYDLYATRWRALFSVIMPAAKPGVLAGAVLVFVPSIGDYVVSRVLGGGRRLMLGNYIEMQFGPARNWPLGSALSMALLILVAAVLVLNMRGSARRTVGNG